MKNQSIRLLIDSLKAERGLSEEAIVASLKETLENALHKKGHVGVEATIDLEEDLVSATCIKEVVKEAVRYPLEEISLEEAAVFVPDIEPGQNLCLPIDLETLDLSVIEKVRQSIIQHLRSLERESAEKEFREKENKIVSGIVSGFKKGAIVVELGKIKAIIPKEEQIPMDRDAQNGFKFGDRISALVLPLELSLNEDVQQHAALLLSRAHPEFVRQLFINEVPELRDGTIEIVAMAREAGEKTKIALKSNDSMIEAVGTMVGKGGMRISPVRKELREEKIDLLTYSSEPMIFLQNLFYPIQILKVRMSDDGRRMGVVVDDEDCAKALGKRKVNASLSAQLLGLDELDIQSVTDYSHYLSKQKERILSSGNEALLNQGIETLDIKELIKDALAVAGITTVKELLESSKETLISAGISEEFYDGIIEQLSTLEE